MDTYAYFVAVDVDTRAWAAVESVAPGLVGQSIRAALREAVTCAVGELGGGVEVEVMPSINGPDPDLYPPFDDL